ncbi:unnamed protein product [Blepharisma stoltei]|uniref:SH3 domain-containing protein n=1 Tax=Blepharisma stoltei TaxID=1481888 RepID=A0AAU9IJD9_9CILI|nr:unnamed protein product [Blepharisma stoltei]
MKPKIQNSRGHFELRHKLEIDHPESSFTYKSPGSVKGIRSPDLRTQSLADPHRTGKSPNSAKNPREKFLKAKPPENKQETSFEAPFKVIEPPKNRIKKTIEKITPHKNNFSVYDPTNENQNSSALGAKNLKIEIETLKKIIGSLKVSHKEQEETLVFQLHQLQQEIMELKAEFAETIGFLAQIIVKYLDKHTPRAISEEMLTKIQEKQERLKIDLDSVIKSISESTNTNISRNTNPFKRDSIASLSSTGHFQSFNESFHFPLISSPINRTFEVISLYDYHPVIEDHLDFQAGERIQVTEMLDEEWWIGILRGKSGKFPKEFVLND